MRIRGGAKFPGIRGINWILIGLLRKTEEKSQDDGIDDIYDINYKYLV